MFKKMAILIGFCHAGGCLSHQETTEHLEVETKLGNESESESGIQETDDDEEDVLTNEDQNGENQSEDEPNDEHEDDPSSTDDTDNSSADGSKVTASASGLPTNLPSTGTQGALTTTIIAPSGIVSDLDVRLSLTHSCTKDLSAALESPSGTTIELFNFFNYPLCSSDMTNTTLDDDGAQPIGSGSNPFSSAYQPNEPLGRFNGEEAAGVWTLIFTDNQPGDAGTLLNAEIDFRFE